jgi:phosphate-selective porin OprO/OprP
MGESPDRGLLMVFLNRSLRTLLIAGAATGAMSIPGVSSAQETVSTAAPGTASAEDPRDVRLRALENALSDLQEQIRDLKASQSSGFKDVRTQVSNLPQTTFSNGRPQIASANGDFKAALRTVVQFDAANYSVSPLTPATDLSSGTNFRRARLGVDATVYKDWNLAIWGEFGGSGSESPALNQAYIEYVGFKPFGLNNPLRLRVGAWATPTGLEDATSNTESIFLERPAAAELVRNLAGGDGRSGVGAFANGERWYASAVLTGAVVGAPAAAEFDEQKGVLARLAFNPIHGKDYDVHVGANFQGVLEPADTAAGPARIQQVRLRERPELRVDGTRLVDTGIINADRLFAYGLEAGASFRQFYVQGEWFKTEVSRTTVGAAASTFDPSFTGWYVLGAVTLTGERHQWNSANGGFRGIRPAKLFDPAKGTWGAFEIAARYSWLDLNDHEGLPGAATPFGGIRGGGQKITTVGLNWYPNNVVRFLLDYQWIRVDRLNAAGLQVGSDVDVVSVRSQFAF